MRTVKFDSTNELIIKNSCFITLLFRITGEDDIPNIMSKVKTMYPKATHYCYGYILDNKQKSSDDGEPGGTAGMPILNVLLKEDLINILAVTVRYFGGEKLGAGGLVRAYTKSITEALQKNQILELEEGYLVKVSVSYEKQKQMDYLLKKYQVINKEFSKDVTYIILIAKRDLDVLSNYSYQIIKEEYIEKAL